MFDEKRLQEIIAEGVRDGMIAANAVMYPEPPQAEDKPKKTRKAKKKEEPKAEEEAAEQAEIDEEFDPETDDDFEEPEKKKDPSEQLTPEEFMDGIKKIFAGNFPKAKEFLKENYDYKRYTKVPQNEYNEVLAKAKENA